ncbi:MAG: hypothetical protein E5X53_04725 [Mesorhizobium sp.]|jgi:hypothetical protein|uniref:hypothetical protein n=1 Tax=Mesorhizobium sp. TaxID=1871066 RepID=UPI000FE5AF87|nr:hypothetical protein [Mesorhizobium sp.]RWM21019.1 MAG: hypothetical protein EOR73_12580 [Mesorhizobium sp.]TIP75929.1 MAG: hypothetical protein E5X55_02360 [Mesorhizobium sp.]TIQ13628.1 MAG: hypothetical protein E5X57_08025 [Mesorhizobium sp.]TIR53561.1 MAG: hypothetical protein E5X53_04725 [Mesorhizobium sp.]TJV97797.1 MAG: hypothetical protein E5X52_12255 [Mesorhizobium sp.]
MKKSILSALGLAIALAFSMPVLGVSSANAASTTAAATTAAPAKIVKKVAAKKIVKKHKRHAAETKAAPKT